MAKPLNDQALIERAKELHLKGLSLSEIAKQIGTSKGIISIWVHHITLVQRANDEKKRYSRSSKRDVKWGEIQDFYNGCRSVKKCAERFSITEHAIERAFLDGNLTKIPYQHTLEEILVENSPYSTGNARKRLLSSGTKAKACEECGITEWNGKSITFALHHINGINNDHRLENLCLLCPNCHSQTETYKGRNKIASKKRSATV